MIKERYKEEYEEGSDLLWPSDKEDKITRQFYKDLSILSKKIIYSKKIKLRLFELVIRIINNLNHYINYDGANIFRTFNSLNSFF